MIQTESINVAAAVTSAVAAGGAVALDHVAITLFGVPLALLIACFAGAMFGATWFPPDSKVSRPWAVLTYTLAGVFLTALVFAIAGIKPDPAIKGGVGFLVASSPLLIIRWLSTRLTGAQPVASPASPAPPSTAGDPNA
jgi:hypothetical protein